MHKVNFEKNESIVSIGDNVEIITSEGKYYRFIVEKLTQEQIGGEGFIFLTSDILEIRKEGFSFGLTAGAVGAVLVVAAFYIALSTANQLAK